MPLYNAMLKREYTECATWNANVIARLNAVHPDLVLVSNSRWVFPLAAADRSRAREGAALARMIGQIPGRVAIIVDVPLPYNDVPECLAAHATPTSARVPCPARRTSAMTWASSRRPRRRRPGADLIDLTAGICPGSGPAPS